MKNENKKDEKTDPENIAVTGAVLFGPGSHYFHTNQ
jgi:hypothetical protein